MARGPLYLIADSQLLFGPPARALAGLIGDRADPSRVVASYLGASNGDAPAFYQLFREAMVSLGVTDVRHVHAPPDDNDRAHVTRADHAVEPGRGEARPPGRGIPAGEEDEIRARHEDGAIVVGLSAGAIQLGHGYLELVAATVDVHAEPDWEALTGTVEAQGGGRGLGIPRGGGLVVAGDGAMTAIRRAAIELTRGGRRELVAQD